MNVRAGFRPDVRSVLLALLGIVAVLALAGWWLATHHRVQEVVDLPRTGEARRNPLFALQVALEKDGRAAQSRRRLQLLPGPGDTPAVPLGARDTVVLYNDPRTLGTDEITSLLAWVEDGGHLVVRTPPHGMLGRNAPAPLLSALGLQLRDGDASGCEFLDDGTGERLRGALFCSGRRFTLDGANPVRSWGDLRDGYVFARIAHGDGSVDVLADLEFLGTDDLDAPASGVLARQLLQPNHGHGTVHLVYAAQMPSLWTTLAAHSWMAWSPLLLAFLLWLWARMQRFGPLLPAPAAERRSLLEHIAASGEHLARHRQWHLLHDAVREAFLARLRRRDPQAAALHGEPQLMLLRQRFPDVAAAELRAALQTPLAGDRAAFRSRIATLVRLRNRL